MDNQWLSNVASLDLPSQHLLNDSPIKILSILCILVALSALLQLCLIMAFHSYSSTLHLWMVALHFVAFLVIYQLNRQGHFTHARAAMMVCFMSLISCTSILWQVKLNYHYFIIPALFLSPFMYFPWEYRRHLGNALLYGCGFILLEAWSLWRFGDISMVFTPPGMLIILSKTLLLIVSMVCSIFLKAQLNRTLVSGQKTNDSLKQLLHKVIPMSVCKNLLHAKNRTQSAAYIQSHGSVLFADMQGYTEFSQSMQSSALVNVLDDLYSQMDTLAARFELQKIKTNGDQYIAVSGLFEQCQDDATRLVEFAVALQSLFEQFCIHHKLPLALRVGIASGEVCAGVIGRSSLAFDIWGDTVNLASRLESQGMSGKIQICPKTYELVQHAFRCQKRPQIKLKGIGTITPLWISSEHHVSAKHSR